MLPGFRVKLNYAPQLPMRAEDAYLTSIELIYGLAAPPGGWDAIVPTGESSVSRDVNGVRVGWQSLAKEGDRYRLQYKHVIVGVLETMNAFARKDRFCFTQTILFLHNIYAGDMAIGRRAPDADGVNVTLGDIGPTGNTTESGIPPEEGEIVDPEDSEFVISYDRMQGSIPCKTLLNAALNGMANSAPFSNNDPCRDHGGFDSTGTVAYTFTARSPGTSSNRMSWVMVRTVLELLPKRLYEQRICGAVEFDLIYSGEKLGFGSFYLF